MAYMRDNGTVVSLTGAGVLVAGFGAYLLWTRRRAGKPAINRLS
jgi:hypothetical protein